MPVFELVVHGRRRVGRDVVSAGAAHDAGLALGDGGEAFGLRLSQHPFERNLGQRAVAFGVAAADVAVRAREPDLLQVLRAGGAAPFGVPKAFAEERAAFVDRDRVAADFDRRVVGAER